jgi:hypothetical protein
MPLFTQVVTVKVEVLQTRPTLVVLELGQKRRAAGLSVGGWSLAKPDTRA